MISFLADVEPSAGMAAFVFALEQLPEAPTASTGGVPSADGEA